MTRRRWLDGIALSCSLAALVACTTGGEQYAPSLDAAGEVDPGALGFVVDNFPDELDELANHVFTIKLNRAPSGPLQVAVRTTGEVRVAPDRFELSEASWQAGQQLTLTALDDDDADDDAAEVTIEADTLTASKKAVTVHDLDELALELQAASPVSVPENGTGTFRLRLTAQPASDVVLALASSSAAVTVAGTATFTRTSWQDFQTITLTGAIDANLDNEDAIITIRETSNLGIRERTVGARAIDRDRLNLVTDASSVTVLENSTGERVGVRLNLPPPGEVVVTVRPPAGVAEVDQATLRFDGNSWNTFKYVQVRAPHDPNLDDATGDLVFTAPTGSETLSATVGVIVRDDDRQVIRHDAGSELRVVEGTGVQVQVWLDYPPQGTVQVQVESLGSGVATAEPAGLTFTAMSYSTPKTITVTGVSDLNLDDALTTVRLSGAGASAVTFAVAVDDDDTQRLEVTPSPVTVVEDATATLMVKPRFQPSGPITVATSSADPQTIEIMSGASLGFGPNDWTSPKAVVLRAPRDSDLTDETVQLTVTGGGATEQVTATVDDRTELLTFGWKAAFPAVYTDSLYQGFVYARKLTIGQTGRVKKLGLRVKTGGAAYKLGLYASTVVGGVSQPGAYVIDSGVVTLVAGDREVDVDAPLAAAGDYWLVVASNVTTSIEYSSGALVPSCSDDRPFASAVPTGTFGPGSTCTSDAALNLWVVLER